MRVWQLSKIVRLRKRAKEGGKSPALTGVASVHGGPAKAVMGSEANSNLLLNSTQSSLQTDEQMAASEFIFR